MIYEFPEEMAPIRQGDIFKGIPRVDISLREMSIVNERNEPEAVAWEAIRSDRETITALVGLKSVWAIVITQDCDTIRSPDITLCEVKPFFEVVRVGPPTTAKAWVNLLRRQAMTNLKWFYLPPDERIGFPERMAADYLTTIRVPREDLEDRRYLRTGRLNSHADEHFRERLAEFFRRYPYNEWYPFNKDEFEAYRADNPQEAPGILPYDHQV